jgi:hypothetical protein
MTLVGVRQRRQEEAGPWFQSHPVTAIVVGVALFAAITALRVSIAGTEEPISELYALPIALLAMTFGFRVGTLSGIAGITTMAVWAYATDVSLTPLGWATRAVPMVLLGVLLGSSSDKIRASREREREAAAIAVLQREAAEVNDSVVQGLTAAKWLLEAHDLERGLATVTETMTTAQGLVSQMLGAHSPLPGDLRRSRQPVTAKR